MTNSKKRRSKFGRFFLYLKPKQMEMKNFKKIPSIIYEEKNKSFIEDYYYRLEVEKQKQSNFHNRKKYLFLMFIFLFFAFILIVASV